VIKKSVTVNRIEACLVYNLLIKVIGKEDKKLNKSTKRGYKSHVPSACKPHNTI
jgi:hypothetical protein